MDTTVERVDDTTVKLSVTVEAARVARAVDAAARTMATQVKVPGFRPGRVPRRVLESRVGLEALLQEAARDALPTFYGEAVERESLAVVSPPELDVDLFTESEGAVFTATVEVRPDFEIPDVAGLQVAHPDWELTEEEVSEQLDMLRERFAELETVERPAQVGDYAVVTVVGTRDGERVEEASGEDLLYTIGDAETTDSELDRHVVGARAGDVVEFDDALGEDYGEELGGVEVAFRVIVKEVKAKQLPVVDDDFAITATEFDTADELLSELRRQMGGHKLGNARAELRGKVVEAVSELVEVPLPKAMVAGEVRFRLQRLQREAERYGLQFDQYVQMAGTSPDELFANLETEAGKTIKAQLVVDAIGRDRGVEIDQSDLGTEIARQAARLDRDPAELAQLMTHPDRIAALISDVFRRRTIDLLVEEVEVLAAPDAQTLAAYGGAEEDAVESHDAEAAIAAAETAEAETAEAEAAEAEAGTADAEDR